MSGASACLELFHARGNKSFKDKNKNFIFVILKKQRFSFLNVYFGELFVWELKPSEILDCEANTFRLSSDSSDSGDSGVAGEAVVSGGDNECHLRQDQRRQSGSQDTTGNTGDTRHWIII